MKNRNIQWNITLPGDTFDFVNTFDTAIGGQQHTQTLEQV